MTTLGGIWDGEKHYLEPGEHFADEGAYLVVESFSEQEEEDVLSPFESRSMEPVLRDSRTREDDPRFPNRNREQAWGALSVALTAFANIAGVWKQQYQENQYHDKTVQSAWSFEAKQPLGERV